MEESPIVIIAIIAAVVAAVAGTLVTLGVVAGLITPDVLAAMALPATNW